MCFVDGEYRFSHERHRGRFSPDDGFIFGGIVAQLVDVAVFIFTSPGTWFATQAPAPKASFAKRVLLSMRARFTLPVLWKTKCKSQMREGNDFFLFRFLSNQLML